MSPDSDNVSRVSMMLKGSIGVSLIKNKAHNKFIDILSSFDKNHSSIGSALTGDAGRLLVKNHPKEFFALLKKDHEISHVFTSKTGMYIVENNLKGFSQTVTKMTREDSIHEILQSNVGKIFAKNDPGGYTLALINLHNIGCRRAGRFRPVYQADKILEENESGKSLIRTIFDLDETSRALKIKFEGENAKIAGFSEADIQALQANVNLNNFLRVQEGVVEVSLKDFQAIADKKSQEIENKKKEQERGGPSHSAFGARIFLRLLGRSGGGAEASSA